MRRLFEYLLFVSILIVVFLYCACDVNNAYTQVFSDVAILILALHLIAANIVKDPNCPQERVKGDKDFVRDRHQLLSIGGCAILVILVSLDLVFAIGDPNHEVFMLARASVVTTPRTR
ncbi:MAG: hypothetical protein NTW96_24410 [Planctomycetia bacterium]|nr:hypothetical protein [Planctomycetia bacterium]